MRANAEFPGDLTDRVHDFFCCGKVVSRRNGNNEEVSLDLELTLSSNMNTIGKGKRIWQENLQRNKGLRC